MKETVIDPSEILIDSEGTYQEPTYVANPWVRFLARMFDYSLFFMALAAIRYAIKGPLLIDGIDTHAPIEFIVWIPIEALLLWAFKTTPGKLWFRISLKQGRLDRLDFMTALRRAFRIWIRGIGLGIPFINGLCMMVAYHRLKLFQITSWDREDHIQVTNLPLTQSRLVIGAVVAICGMSLRTFW